MRYLVPLFILVLIGRTLHAQVNTERFHQDYDKKGFLFTNALGFDFETGNTRKLDISNEFRGYYNGEKTDYLSAVDYDLETRTGVKKTHKGFLHFRSMHQLDTRSVFQLEEYTQLQFDEFILLKRRFLLGAGIRFNPVKKTDTSDTIKTSLKIFLGTGLFFETERYSTMPASTFHLIRWSSYVSLVWAIKKGVNLNLVNYIQPAISDFNNYRYYLTLSLSTLITKKLYYDFSVNYHHRNQPVGGTKPTDLELTNALRFRF